jgi:hypothetical protein
MFCQIVEYFGGMIRAELQFAADSVPAFRNAEKSGIGTAAIPVLAHGAW